MKWIVLLNSILIYYGMICEDVIRPKEKEDCLNRTFVGEFNRANAYCCFLEIEKYGNNIKKCSIHFKEEIDNDQIYNTIDFLKYVNTHYEDEEVTIKSLECISKYIKTIYLMKLFIYIIFEFFI